VETNRIARAIIDATAAFQGYRLPELFAGLDRMPGSFPVQYIGANVPQAWAAGSVFLLLQSILGLTANAPGETLYVWPTLPDWLPDITVSNLRFGSSRISIHFTGTGANSSYEVLESDGRVQVERQVPSVWTP
jgi:glycogen debranching enzyme